MSLLHRIIPKVAYLPFVIITLITLLLLPSSFLPHTDKIRSPTSVTRLNKRQQAGNTELRHLCRKNGILFSLVFSPKLPPTLLKKVWMLLQDFQHHTEDCDCLAPKAGWTSSLLARFKLGRW